MSSSPITFLQIHNWTWWFYLFYYVFTMLIIVAEYISFAIHLLVLLINLTLLNFHINRFIKLITASNIIFFLMKIKMSFNNAQRRLLQCVHFTTQQEHNFFLVKLLSFSLVSSQFWNQFCSDYSPLAPPPPNKQNTVNIIFVIHHLIDWGSLLDSMWQTTWI